MKLPDPPDSVDLSVVEEECSVSGVSVCCLVTERKDLRISRAREKILPRLNQRAFGRVECSKESQLTPPGSPPTVKIPTSMHSQLSKRELSFSDTTAAHAWENDIVRSWSSRDWNPVVVVVQAIPTHACRVTAEKRE